VDTIQAPRGGRPLASAEVSITEPGEVSTAGSFGAMVRAARISRALPQEEMAARLGVSRGLLAGLERGDRGVRLDLALKIFEDLGFKLVALPPGYSARDVRKIAE
jgi:transcriptional regulator with XRE-family HTH domain